MKKLILAFSVVLLISCQSGSKKQERKIELVVQSDTLIVVEKTEFSSNQYNETMYSFAIKGDTLATKFRVSWDDVGGSFIKCYALPVDDFVWLQKLAEHLAERNNKINAISLGGLASLPFADEITIAYRAKHGRDVSTKHYEHLEAIIMESKLVTMLDGAIKPLGVTSNIGVEKVFFTKNHIGEILDCMVWATLSKKD